MISRSFLTVIMLASITMNSCQGTDSSPVLHSNNIVATETPSDLQTPLNNRYVGHLAGMPAGIFVNQNLNTKGIVMVNLIPDDNLLYTQVWGACSSEKGLPEPCDWGIQPVDVSSGVLNVTYNNYRAIHEMQLGLLSNGQLETTTKTSLDIGEYHFNHFKDFTTIESMNKLLGAGSSAGSFGIEGFWANEDENTNDIPLVRIGSEDGTTFMWAWGTCSDENSPVRYCTWGAETASVIGKDNLSVLWDRGFVDRKQKISLLPDGRLRIETKSEFKDNNLRRSDYTTIGFFSKVLSTQKVHKLFS